MYVCEYIWLDSDGDFRRKTGIREAIAKWDYDGSSTGQADVKNSEIVLSPCYTIKDPFKTIDGFDCVIVLCETHNVNGTPHETNERVKCGIDDCEPWFGFEQEFFIKVPNEDESNDKYCKNNLDYGREVVEKAFNICLQSGIHLTGMNAEVAPWQWEFQVFGKGIVACDQLLMARYIFKTVLEYSNFDFILHPKPIINFNGSGCHVSFSTTSIRDGTYNVEKFMKKFEETHSEDLKVYGVNNNLRLSGTHETSSLEKFSWGRSDRSVSVRIRNGYIEDRRPASNVNPYTVASRLLEKTLCMS